MILTRNEKEQTVDALYESSNILSSKYNRETKELTITFKKGTTYKYNDVSAKDYLRFETAESQGKVLNSHIKSHDFQKLGDVDVNDIISRIDESKKQEGLERAKAMAVFMKSVAKAIEENGVVKHDEIKKIEGLLVLIRESGI